MIDSDDGEATSKDTELSGEATTVDIEALPSMVIDAEEPPLTVMVEASAMVIAVFFYPVQPQQTLRHLRLQQRLP